MLHALFCNFPIESSFEHRSSWSSNAVTAPDIIRTSDAFPFPSRKSLEKKKYPGSLVSNPRFSNVLTNLLKRQMLYVVRTMCQRS